ncbi:hypothetical protein KGM_208277A, partial [Danaus plexippus plexippus]
MIKEALVTTSSGD